MRDLEFDSQSFVRSVEDYFNTQYLRDKEAELLSRITPSASRPFQNNFLLRTHRKKELILLAIFSWYIDEGLGLLLRFSIREKVNSDDLKYLELLLESKGQMLVFLEESSEWSCRDFFGNILTKENRLRIYSLFKPEFESRKKPKRLQRHRGYRDHGSLRLNHEIHECWRATAEQNEIESKRQEISDTLNFLRGFLFGG